jgi:hypothetical protein
MEEDLLTIEEKKTFNLKSLLSVKKILGLFLVLLFLNTIYIDILIIQGLGGKQTIVQRFESITNQAPTVLATPNSNICPQSCVTQINQALASNKPVVLSPTATPISTVSPLSQTTTSSVKEYYVPFGSGSGSSSDWQDVPGLSAGVDSSAYGNIKSVVFEASLHIPTGNETAGVRLYNATDNHPVWNSELDFNGNSNSVLLVSSNLTLDSGNKVYKVQIKTQLQYQAILDQSRLHLTSN